MVQCPGQRGLNWDICDWKYVEISGSDINKFVYEKDRRPMV
jgi:hypothetical protein